MPIETMPDPTDQSTPADSRLPIDRRTVAYNVNLAGARAGAAASESGEDAETEALVSSAATAGSHAFRVAGLYFPEPTFGALIAVRRMVREIPGIDGIDSALLTALAYYDPRFCIRSLDAKQTTEIIRAAERLFADVSLEDMRRLDAWIASTINQTARDGEATADALPKPAGGGTPGPSAFPPTAATTPPSGDSGW